MPGHWVWFTLPLLHFPGLHRVWVGRDYTGALSPRTRLGRTAWDLGQRVVRWPRRVLAVGAHPDDLEYFCGGTLALYARAGARVVGVRATRGERGGRLPRLPEVRVAEQQEAARRLGYTPVILDFPDRGLDAQDPALRQALQHLLNQEQPDLVLTFDPDRPFPVYRHPDHLAVARALLDLWPGPALLFHTRQPNVVVDITAVFRDKVAAFAAHKSQLPRRGTARLVAWHLRGRSRGRDACGRTRYVEVFRLAGTLPEAQSHGRAAGE